MSDWKEIIKNDDRYEDFTIVDNPTKFKDMFSDLTIECVQLHLTQVWGESIVGFCGAFKWKDNKIIPLDGDSYSADVLVLGYDWFTDDDGMLCLDILVGNDW